MALSVAYVRDRPQCLKGLPWVLPQLFPVVLIISTTKSNSQLSPGVALKKQRVWRHLLVISILCLSVLPGNQHVTSIQSEPLSLSCLYARTPFFFFFFCIFLGLESCPQLKLDGDWTCCVACISPSPRASSYTLCFHYPAWIFSFCLHSGACKEGLYSASGALRLPNVCHAWKAESIH